MSCLSLWCVLSNLISHVQHVVHFSSLHSISHVAPQIGLFFLECQRLRQQIARDGHEAHRWERCVNLPVLHHRREARIGGLRVTEASDGDAVMSILAQPFEHKDARSTRHQLLRHGHGRRESVALSGRGGRGGCGGRCGGRLWRLFFLVHDPVWSFDDRGHIDFSHANLRARERGAHSIATLQNLDQHATAAVRHFANDQQRQMQPFRAGGCGGGSSAGRSDNLRGTGGVACVCSEVGGEGSVGFAVICAHTSIA